MDGRRLGLLGVGSRSCESLVFQGECMRGNGMRTEMKNCSVGEKISGLVFNSSFVQKVYE